MLEYAEKDRIDVLQTSEKLFQRLEKKNQEENWEGKAK